VRWLVYQFSRFVATLFFALIGTVRVLHRERTAIRGAYILATNHISHFDPPILSIVARRKIDWMGMVELFQNAVIAAGLRAIDTFPTDRARVDRESVRTALARLRRGHVVGIFPEGGIRDGARSVLEGVPPKPGVVTLARLADVPILPCAIIGTDRLYDWKMWLPLFRRARVWIAFGEPIYAPAELHKAEARNWMERELSRAFCGLFAELREQFQLEPDDLPQPPARRKGAM
jgi:1-acyl-sn-glycerol-3-phosphate acyltransferase